MNARVLFYFFCIASYYIWILFVQNRHVMHCICEVWSYRVIRRSFITIAEMIMPGQPNIACKTAFGNLIRRLWTGFFFIRCRYYFKGCSPTFNASWCLISVKGKKKYGTLKINIVPPPNQPECLIGTSRS